MDMEVLTVEEAAKILKLSPYTVRELLKKQKLPGIKIGGGRQWRIRKADLEAYLHNAGPS
jgi:excisionase family DNA binding protein